MLSEQRSTGAPYGGLLLSFLAVVASACFAGLVVLHYGFTPFRAAACLVAVWLTFILVMVHQRLVSDYACSSGPDEGESV